MQERGSASGNNSFFCCSRFWGGRWLGRLGGDQRGLGRAKLRKVGDDRVKGKGKATVPQGSLGAEMRRGEGGGNARVVVEEEEERSEGVDGDEGTF